MKFRRKKTKGMLAIQLLKSPLGKLEDLSVLRPRNHQRSQSKQFYLPRWIMDFIDETNFELLLKNLCH
jgi:hypothetical protein